MGEHVKKSFIINTIYFGIWLVLIVISCKFLFKYIFPFIVALIVASLMQKPARAVSAKTRLKKGFCAVFFSATAYLFFAGALMFLIFKLLSSGGTFIEYLSNFSNKASEFIQGVEAAVDKRLGNVSGEFKNTGNKILRALLDNGVSKISEFISNFAASAVKTAPAFLFTSIVALAGTCYIARDYDGLLDFVKRLLKPKTAEKINLIFKILKESVFKILAGYIILTIITFFELSVGLVALGVKKWLLLAFIIALFDALPILGAGAVLIPWGLISIILGNKYFGTGILILYLVLVAVRNFAESKIVGNKTGINPLFILFTMFLGLKLFGFLGLAALPVTFIVVVKYYKNEMEQELS